MTTQEIQTAAGAATATAVTAADPTSWAHMLPQMEFVALIVALDFVTGIYRSYKAGIKIRFSRAGRETLAKIVFYATAIMVACCFNAATPTDYAGVEEGLCVAIYVFEGASVVSNILKVHGYNIDFTVLVKMLAAKFGVTGDDAAHLIKKDDDPTAHR